MKTSHGVEVMGSDSWKVEEIPEPSGCLFTQGVGHGPCFKVAGVVTGHVIRNSKVSGAERIEKNRLSFNSVMWVLAREYMKDDSMKTTMWYE
jgi:hypothetical protein